MKNKSKNEVAIMKVFENSKKLYLSVLSQLNIDHSDAVYSDLVLGMIERQTRDHLVFSIWNNMDDAQAKHFRDYFNQMSVIAPWASSDDLLIEFALMYPALMEKIYASLSVFFQNFIKKFNEIEGS